MRFWDGHERTSSFAGAVTKLINWCYLLKPGVLQRIGGRDAPRRVGLEQAADDSLRTRIHAAPVLRRKAVVALYYVGGGLLHRLIQERRQLMKSRY